MESIDREKFGAFVAESRKELGLTLAACLGLFVPVMAAAKRYE